MKSDFSHDDQIILDRLLTKLGSWADGAVDYWTVVILGNFPCDHQDFVAHQCERMRAHVVVAQLVLAEAHQAEKEPLRSLLESMYSDCQKLEKVFYTLDQFQDISLEEIRSATDNLAEIYNGLRASIHQFAESTGLALSYEKGRSEEREQYYQGILKGLFNLFVYERESRQAAAPVPQESGSPVA